MLHSLDTYVLQFNFYQLNEMKNKFHASTYSIYMHVF